MVVARLVPLVVDLAGCPLTDTKDPLTLGEVDISPRTHESRDLFLQGQSAMATREDWMILVDRHALLTIPAVTAPTWCTVSWEFQFCRELSSTRWADTSGEICENAISDHARCKLLLAHRGNVSPAVLLRRFLAMANRLLRLIATLRAL